MDIIDISAEEYCDVVRKPFSRFETSDFVELNKHKVSEIKYFLFRNNKVRFALVGGNQDGVLKFPFSASYSILSVLSNSNPISYYYESLQSLIDYAKSNGIKQIVFNTPPMSYDVSHITKMNNALLGVGFAISSCDINFEFNLIHYDESSYRNNMHYNARKNYQTACNANLFFEKSNDFELAYDIIRINRQERGFPLRMTLEEVKKTSEIIPTDLFVVKTSEGTAIASAIVHHLKEKIVRVVYWGNTEAGYKLRPVNFLSYNLFKYYANSGDVDIIDIGTSTVDGIPNFGLCDFKESIGCVCSPKINFVYSINP